MSPVLVASHAEACRHAPHNNASDVQALQLANLLKAFPAVNAHGTRQREADGREIIIYVIAEGGVGWGGVVSVWLVFYLIRCFFYCCYY